MKHYVIPMSLCLLCKLKSGGLYGYLHCFQSRDLHFVFSEKLIVAFPGIDLCPAAFPGIGPDKALKVRENFFESISWLNFAFIYQKQFHRAWLFEVFSVQRTFHFQLLFRLVPGCLNIQCKTKNWNYNPCRFSWH